MRDIILEDGQVVSNVQKLYKRDDITEGTKLYYELGYRNFGKWVRTGKYREISDPIKFRDWDDRLDDLKYIAHHNFCIKNVLTPKTK